MKSLSNAVRRLASSLFFRWFLIVLMLGGAIILGVLYSRLHTGSNPFIYAQF